MTECIVPALYYGNQNILPHAEALGELDARADYSIRRSASPPKYMKLYYNQASPLARLEAQGIPPALSRLYNAPQARAHTYLLELTLDGGGLIDCGGEHSTARPGLVSFLDCGQDHCLRTDPEAGHWRKLYAYLSGPCVAAYFSAFRAACGEKCCFETAYDGELRARFDALAQLYSSGQIARFLDVKAATAICELLSACVDAATESAQRTRAPGVVQEAMRYLSAHYREKITLDDLSTRFAVEKCHFQKLFTRYNGLSPNEYLIATRMHRAKELLCEGRLSIAETGEAVGIDNTSYFIKQFKRREGVTPAQYRRRMQGEPSMELKK